jgi:hypothetical protein
MRIRNSNQTPITFTRSRVLFSSGNAQAPKIREWREAGMETGVERERVGGDWERGEGEREKGRERERGREG